MRRLNALALIVLAVLLVAGFTYQNTKPRFEYKTVPIPLADEKLNALGDEGWELITVIETTTPIGVRPVHYFRRQK